MYTNQAAIPGEAAAPEQHCRHAPGEAATDTCQYLRALARIALWVERASEAHESGRSERQQLGDLWLLHAQLSYALDHCPNVRPYQDASVLVCALEPAPHSAE